MSLTTLAMTHSRYQKVDFAGVGTDVEMVWPTQFPKPKYNYALIFRVLDPFVWLSLAVACGILWIAFLLTTYKDHKFVYRAISITFMPLVNQNVPYSWFLLSSRQVSILLLLVHYITVTLHYCNTTVLAG